MHIRQQDYNPVAIGQKVEVALDARAHPVPLDRLLQGGWWLVRPPLYGRRVDRWLFGHNDGTCQLNRAGQSHQQDTSSGLHYRSVAK